MIIGNNNKTRSMFVNLNNDIYRIISIINSNQTVKRLLKYTDSNPLSSDKIDVEEDMRDEQICRIPVLPYDENQGSICVVTFINGDVVQESKVLNSMLCIDVFSPSNQWVIDGGLRPMLLLNEIDNIIASELKQTGGVRYRLKSVVNSQLADILVGYRMMYESIIDN